MIVAVNKCNITGLTLDILNKLRWGTSCIDKEDIILENYIGFLDCDTVKPQVCNPNDCNNDTIVFVCSVSVTFIAKTINEDNRTITFVAILGLDINGDPNGIPPFSYEWSYNEEDFDLSSELNQQSIILILKEGKSFDNLVSPVTVVVTDANGCTDTKTCYLVVGGMQCSDNYVACPNANNLIVVNKITQCSGVSSLIVTIKE